MPILITLSAALTGALLFEKLRIPAGALIGAMVAVAALRLADLPATDLPALGRFLAFAALGWAIGEGVTRDVLRTLVGAAVPVLATVLALVLFGAFVAWVLVRLGVLDPATAFLVASPGALSQMAAMSDAVGANTPVVVTVHVVRIVTIIALAPVVVRLLPPP